MNKLLGLSALLLGVVFAGISVVVTAEPESADSASSVAVEPTAKAQEIAVEPLIGICAACHGPDGNSTVATFPKIAGQHTQYLFKQLNDIKSGDRVVPAMTGMLDSFDDKQLQAIAEHFSAQTMTLNQALDKDLKLGEKIYRLGIASKGLPACSGCHSPTGQGNALAGFPVLGGQHAEYIATTLKAFREGAEYPEKGRSNDQMQGVMRDIAMRLSDREIAAVANYISGLY